MHIEQGGNLMRPIFRLLFALLVLAAIFRESAHAQSTAIYVVSYVETMPNATAAGRSSLKRYRDASRKDDGNLRFDVLQEIARPNRFAIVELWKDNTALDAHGKTANTAQFRDALQAIAEAPPDQRVDHGLYVQPMQSDNRANAIYVVTHVDVIPSGKDDCLHLLEAMRTDTRSEPGNIAYDVLQQANRGNHFTVVEEWTNRKALDAHAIAAHTRAFREKLLPLAGALFDERFYKAL
jgi:quinol monooxygenase YgiN